MVAHPASHRCDYRHVNIVCGTTVYRSSYVTAAAKGVDGAKTFFVRLLQKRLQIVRRLQCWT